MNVQLTNAVGTKSTFAATSLDEVMGKVGPMYPVSIDGRIGHVTHRDATGNMTDVVRFVPTN